MTGGTVPDSAAVPFTAVGTYYWAAFYSGHAHNTAAASDCTTEVLTVRGHPTIVTQASRENGAFFVDTATLTGTGGTITAHSSRVRRRDSLRVELTKR